MRFAAPLYLAATCSRYHRRMVSGEASEGDLGEGFAPERLALLGKRASFRVGEPQGL